MEKCLLAIRIETTTAALVAVAFTPQPVLFLTQRYANRAGLAGDVAVILTLDSQLVTGTSLAV